MKPDEHFPDWLDEEFLDRYCPHFDYKTRVKDCPSCKRILEVLRE